MPGFLSSGLMTDRCEPAVFELGGQPTTFHYVYVDNIGILSTEKEAVEGPLAMMVSHFDGQGLTLHEAEIHEESATALGVELCSREMRVRIVKERLWKVRGAIQALLRRRKVSGRMLEIIIGHATFCSLVNRPLLAFFNTVYRFIRAHYVEAVPLWASAVSELRHFAGCMIFLESEWWLAWNTRLWHVRVNLASPTSGSDGSDFRACTF